MANRKKGPTQKQKSGGKDWGAKIAGDNAPFDPTPWLNYPAVVLFGANHYASRLPDSPAWLVWDKRNGGCDFADCELAWTNYGCAVRKIEHLWNGMLREGKEQRYHPTQKPLKVMTWCISLCKKAETILDPFMGSASTGVSRLAKARSAACSTAATCGIVIGRTCD